jgi:hypothetical protein
MAVFSAIHTQEGNGSYTGISRFIHRHITVHTQAYTYTNIHTQNFTLSDELYRRVRPTAYGYDDERKIAHTVCIAEFPVVDLSSANFT